MVAAAVKGITGASDARLVASMSLNLRAAGMSHEPLAGVGGESEYEWLREVLVRTTIASHIYPAYRGQ